MNLETIRVKYDKRIAWGGGNTFIDSRTDELSIDYIVDIDKSKQGTFCKGIRVEAPEEILKEDMSKTLIIIFSIYWKDIIVQMNNMGITSDAIIYSMINDNDYDYNNVKKGFSAFAEDAIIKGISKRYEIEIKHYVDIGANHPVAGNATISFYQEGAMGCLVEPNSDYIDRIKASRPRDMVLNMGVAGTESDEKERKYYKIIGLDTRNTFSEEIAEYYKKNGFEISTELVKLISLNSLLKRFGKRVDYISIDVEGLEYEILRGFDFNKYNVNFFNIEKSSIEVKNLMLLNHYELVAETPSNWIFVREGKVKEKI